MELDGNRKNWTGRDWTGRAQTPLNGLDMIKLEWNTRQRSGLDLSGLSRSTSED